MRPPRVRLSVGAFLATAVLIAGLTWAMTMVRRASHYDAQAKAQARLEARHRLEAHHLRSMSGATSVANGLVGREVELADRHARLKARYGRLATHPWETPAADLPLPYPWDRKRDCAVLEAALAELRDSAGGRCAEVVVGESTHAWTSDAPRVGENDAWDDLIRRNSGGPVLITGLGLGQAVRVRFDDPERLFEESAIAGVDFRDFVRKRYPHACDCVWLTLPGYSRDGRRAVVLVAGGSSPYSERSMYELACMGGTWIVASRRRRPGE